MASRLAVFVLAGTWFAACDSSTPDTTRGVIGRGHQASVAAPHDPVVVTPSEPDPIEAEPDPVEPDPVNPEPIEPDPDPVEPDPIVTDPEPVEPDPAEPDPVEPSACPTGVVCVTTFPFVTQGDTTLGAQLMDRYSCAPMTNESGPENVYRVEVPTAGLLVARLDDVPNGVDVDVHIVAGASAADPNRCLDRGNWDSTAWVPAGVVWVVVDSWVNASGVAKDGPYSLSLGFTSPTDFLSQDLDDEVLEHALKAYALAWQDGDTERFELTVIDFSLHSIHPRLWTLDVSDGSLLFKQRVSHGEGSADSSDAGWAVRFSNTEGSHQSSIGLMRTASRYNSASNGLSLRLDGLEDGINDQVRARAIVIHSDSYATDAYAQSHGRMGLSWGCQVIEPAQIGAFIDTTEGGSLVYSWYPDDDYLQTSTYIY